MAAGRQSTWDGQRTPPASPRPPALCLVSRDTAQLHPEDLASPSLCSLVSGNKTKSRAINSYLVPTIWTYQNALLRWKNNTNLASASGKLSLRIGVVPLLGEPRAFPGILRPPSMGFSGKVHAHPLSVSVFACICCIAVPHIFLASLS